MAMPAVSVVLVEDSVPYARLVELILADAVAGGVEVRHHDTLRDARADLRERAADCILLDLGLPDANGLEALALVLEVCGGAPVIVLSGHDDEELASATIRAGAQDYLVKGQERPPAPFLRAIRFAIERRSHQERNEDLLRAKEDRWRTLTHLAPVGIVEIDEAGRCVFANDWVSELTGLAREALLGEGWRDALHGDDARAFAAAWRSAAAPEGSGEFGLELRFGAPDGLAHWAQVTGVLLRDPWDGPAGWLGTLVDVTPARQAREALALVEQELRGALLEQERLLEQVRELARTDPLTGLANRRLWDERVSVELARAQRYERPLSVAAIDLDYFKPYNDNFGHQAGDALLREATAAWGGALRVADLLSRWGGDEFALLLPDCDLECAERIVSRLQDLTPGGEEGVGCSAGLVRWVAGESAESVVARADAALYAAKADGRGRIHVA
jgi:diguanylate cyclase (GGDEF)-like protein/PAS domain S-box-containing protein